jgi:hypothetical protein
MMLVGRIIKEPDGWRAECPAMAAYVDGTSREHARTELAETVKAIVCYHTEPGVTITVTETGPVGPNAFAVTVTASRPDLLAAAALLQQSPPGSIAAATTG